MIREVAMLNDSCDLDSLLKSGTDVNEAEITSVCSLGTNERRGNTYSNLIDSTRQPEGKRIDYILYHPGTNYNVSI